MWRDKKKETAPNKTSKREREGQKEESKNKPVEKFFCDFFLQEEFAYFFQDYLFYKYIQFKMFVPWNFKSIIFNYEFRKSFHSDVATL